MCRPLSLDRKGQSFAMVVAFLLVLVALTSLSIDIGMAYLVKARMQAACDAAALAGCEDINVPATADANAKAWASYNGFTHGSNCTVTVIRSPGGNVARFRTEMSQSVPTFVACIVGFKTFLITVGATAEYNGLLPVAINGGSQPGINGVQTLAVFGPCGLHSNGDNLSVQYLNDGVTKNPEYNPNGYDFSIPVDANYATANGTSMMKVEIFDPDAYNPDGSINSDATHFDELRAPNPSSCCGGGWNNVTKYTLYAPDTTPNDLTDDVQIAQATYAQQTATDSVWVTPGSAWTVGTSGYPLGNYRLNVNTIAGSGKNGFNLRAGPPGYNYANPAANVPNTKKCCDISAIGHLPMNINVNGTVKLTLTQVPASALPLKVHVSKFDTDVGAMSVDYVDSHGNTWPGTLAPNDQTREDILTFPANYAGGTLFANYTAGQQDQSTWCVFIEGYVSGVPGKVHLVE